MKKNKHSHSRSMPAAANEFTHTKQVQATSTQNTGLQNTAIQLWPLRGMVEKNLWQTLKKINQIGFAGIEPYGFDGSFFGIAPMEFKEICANLNLIIFSTHTAITLQNAALLAEKAANAGLQYLILPSVMGRPHATTDDYKKIAGELNAIGKICRQHKIRLGYHNHDFELKAINGSIPYDILLQETDNDLVDFQMDVYWLVKAGADPAYYFRNYPGRFTSLHVKDMNKTGDSCIVGNGTIDFKRLIQLSQNTDSPLLIYEQEHFDEGTPLFCAEKSLNNLQTLFA
jgi:sugar phosphate isomerase/epimerase